MSLHSFADFLFFSFCKIILSFLLFVQGALQLSNISVFFFFSSHSLEFKLFFLLSLSLSLFLYLSCPISWGCRIHRLYLFWGEQPGPLWPGMVAPDRVLSMGQIELNCVLILNWITWKRIVLTYNCVWTQTSLILNWIVWIRIVCLH